MTNAAQNTAAGEMSPDRGQRDFIERAGQILSQDDRVLGIWLSGSYGRGDNDEFSDVDLFVVVDGSDLQSFCSDWSGISDQIAPVVLRKQIPDRPVFTQVTSDWLRFDLVVGTADDLQRRTTSTVRPLYDPNGLSSKLGEPGPAKQPDPARVASLTEEFFRVYGLLPVVLGRGEYVVAAKGAGLVTTILIDLMLEDVAVEDRGGAMYLNRLLPEERLQTLTDLPAIEATRDSAIATHRACAAAFLPLARTLHHRCGLEWPDTLEEALRRHLQQTLAIELPGPH